MASYKDLECDTSIKYKDTHKFIPEAVQLGLNNIECVSTGVCFLDRVTVTECNQRQKRSTVMSNAGVDVSLSCDPAVREFYVNAYFSKLFLKTFLIRRKVRCDWKISSK